MKHMKEITDRLAPFFSFTLAAIGAPILEEDKVVTLLEGLSRICVTQITTLKALVTTLLGKVWSTQRHGWCSLYRSCTRIACMESTRCVTWSPQLLTRPLHIRSRPAPAASVTRGWGRKSARKRKTPGCETYAPPCWPTKPSWRSLWTSPPPLPILTVIAS